MRRYEFVTPVDNPHHRSKTCMVLIAIDHKQDQQYVALKMLKYKAQFLTEISTREQGLFQENFVINILRTHDSNEDELFKNDAISKGVDEYPYCLVMPAADRNLAVIIASERMAGGKDWAQIKLVGMQIAEALRHLHERGF